MKIDWILLAEGLGQDSKGAITAIGLNQNLFAATSLPATTKRAVLAHLVADGQPLKQGEKITIRFSVTNPSGDVITAQTAQATVGQRPWPDLPVTSDLSAEMVLALNEYGTYQIEVGVQIPDAEEIKGGVDFYVVRPSQPLSSEEQKALSKD
jgi:hypothetical protein